MSLSLFVSVVPLTIAVFSLLLSLLTYYRDGYRSQLERDKLSKMQFIAGEAMILWQQAELLAFMHLENLKETYMLTSVQRNVHRLEEAIDEAIGLGLFEELLGKHRYSLDMHIAFRQSLTNIEGLDPKTAPIEEWTKQHFTMGIVRLLDQCFNYKPRLFPKSLTVEGVKEKVKGLSHQAWTYLEKE